MMIPSSARSTAPALPLAIDRVLQTLIGIGVVAFGAGLYVAPERTWAAAFMASYFMLGLSLAALLFAAIHYVAGASWHVVFRRVPEAMACMLPIGAIGMLLVLLVHPDLYPWYAAPPPASGLHAFKHAWLSRPFFLARSIAYLICWIGFTAAIVRTSYRQDDNGDPQLTRRNVRLSAAFLVVLSLTLVPASFDWLMSLEPDWYSSIFAFYDFAGLFVSGIAAIVLLVLGVRRLDPAWPVGDSHLHDLGKLLFAFSTFWVYIWFCQYMLIWYGNIQEEAAYFVARQRGWWMMWFSLNPILNWVVPFALLLTERAKKNERMLLLAAAAVLAGRLVDLYLAIFPGLLGPAPRVGLPELGLPAGAIALFALGCFRWLRRVPIIPLRDPGLLKSLHDES